MKCTKVLQLTVAIASFALSVWSMKLMAYNWWAAGGPPVKNAEEYAARGNAFAVVAFVLMAGGVLFIVLFFRRSKST